MGEQEPEGEIKENSGMEKTEGREVKIRKKEKQDKGKKNCEEE